LSEPLLLNKVIAGGAVKVITIVADFVLLFIVIRAKWLGTTANVVLPAFLLHYTGVDRHLSLGNCGATDRLRERSRRVRSRSYLSIYLYSSS